MSALKKLNGILRQVIGKVIALLSAAMLFSIVAEILGREIARVNLDWVIELNRIFFIWIVYLGAACSFGKMAHIRVEVIIENLNGKSQQVLNLIIHLLNCVFFIIIAVYAVDMMMIAKTNVFSTMKISYMWLYMPAFIFGILSVLFTAEHIFDYWAKRGAA